MITVQRSLLIPLPAEAVWAALADFDHISRWAPNVGHSAAASEARDGRGAVRRVQAGRLALLETVTDWQPPERLAYAISGLPPMAGTVTTTWQIAAQPDGSMTSVTTQIDHPANPPGRIVGRVLGRQLAKAADQMLHGLADHLTHLQEQP